MGQQSDGLLAEAPLVPPAPVDRPGDALRFLRVRAREAFSVLVIRRAKQCTEWCIRRTGDDGSATFFDPARFPWVRTVEAEWRSIRAELDAVLSGPASVPEFADLSPAQKALVRGTAWRSFFLHVTGDRHEPNAARCPVTMRLLEKIPGLETAFFSILEPGTRLSPHRGPFGGVLRYHLALEVPEPRESCGIRVGSDVRHWTEGESLVFDDSHDHEAWNESSARRVVLFVDFERPLPGFVRILNRAILRLSARAAFLEELRENLRRAVPG